jgi:hypothetical protein
MAATKVAMNPMKILSLAETGFLPKSGKQIRKAIARGDGSGRGI